MKIGFIGLGIMGKPMAGHLIKKGYETHIYDINSEPVQELARKGGYACHSTKEVAERSNVIITMLPTAKHVEHVLFASDGIACNGMKNTIIIDMSSILPEEAKSFSDRLKEYGMESLDAPVSGGEPLAIDGNLSIMVGGSKDNFNKVAEILNVIGGSVVHIGSNGAGSAVKLANQIIVNVNIAALAEASVLAGKLEIDLEVMFEAIRGGLAGSAVMEAKMPKIIARDFKAGGRIDINNKDLTNVLTAAEAINVQLPITTAVKSMFNSEIESGHASKDHCFIINHIEELSKFKLPNGGIGDET